MKITIIKSIYYLSILLLMLPSVIIFDLIPRLFGFGGLISWYCKETKDDCFMAPVMLIYSLSGVLYIELLIAHVNNFI